MTTETTIQRCFVTSDLHIADGGTLEQFHDDEAFRQWIETIADDSTMVVLNGDVVDFALISPWERPKDLPSHLLWTEAESVEKLERCMAAHTGFFDALAHLHAAGGTVAIVVGNHDLDWIWPAVQARMAQRIGASPHDAGFERLRFELMGVSFGGAWIEHGHRFTAENAPRNAEDPATWIHEHDGEYYLERVWGTDFLISFFNDKHDEYPYLSHIKPTWKVAINGLKRGWFRWGDFVRMTAFLARRGMPLKAAADFTLSGDGPEKIDPNQIAALFDDPEAQEAIASAVNELSRSELTLDPMEQLDGELLSALQDSEGIDISDADFGFGSIDVPEDLTPDGSSPTMGVFRDSREIRAAEEKLFEHEHVVFGHTHVVVDGHEVAPGKRMFNPGCWISHLDMKNPRVKAVIDEHGITAGLLNNHADANDPDQSGGYYTTDFNAIRILRDGSEPELISISSGAPTTP